MKKWLLICLFPLATCFAEPATINVIGEASQAFKADRLTLSCGVVSQAVLASDALEENRTKMGALREAIAALGPSNVATDQFSVRPLYSARPQNASEEWQASISGYEVVNRLHVTTDQLNLAGSLIDAMTLAGANQIDSLRFHLQSSVLQEEEVIRAATQKALSDAQLLADAANVKLGPIVSISLNPRSPQVGFFRADATFIQPADVTLSATVALTVSIQ